MKDTSIPVIPLTPEDAATSIPPGEEERDFVSKLVYADLYESYIRVKDELRMLKEKA